jgi:hypothetical protein
MILDFRFWILDCSTKMHIRRFVVATQVALMLCLLFSLLSCHRQQTRQQEMEKIRNLWLKLDAYRTKKLGPSNFAAYKRIWYRRPGDPVRYNTWGAAGNSLIVLTPAAIAGLPDPFGKMLETYYETTEPTWRVVGAAIEGGGYYSSFAEEEPSTLQHVFSQAPDDLALTTFARDNILKGVFYLSKGQPKKAIDLFAMNLRLGQRMFGKSLWGGSNGAQIVGNACGGYDQILWQPMDRETARYALQSCRDIRIPVEDHKTLAIYAELLSSYMRESSLSRTLGGLRSAFVSNWLMWQVFEFDPGREEYTLDVLKKPDFKRIENRRWLERIRRKKESVSYFEKITTLPAMRKLLRHILATEPDFQKKPVLFDDSDLKSLPPELEVALRIPRVFSPPHPSWIYIHRATTRLELLRVALAARIFRAENGRWPSSVAELQAADLITTPTTYFPAPLTIVDLYAKYPDRPTEVDGVVGSALANLLLEGSQALRGTGSEIQFMGPTEQRPTLVFTLKKVPEMTLTMLEQSLLAFAPFVSHVRRVRAVRGTQAAQEVKDGVFPIPPPGNPVYTEAVVEADFHRPKHFWWVYTWGPDGKDDGGIIAYDPVNGTISRGDIGQFIGCE